MNKSLPQSRNKHVILIDKNILSLLRDHKKRTGIGPNALLRGKRLEKPEGLTSGMIKKWITGENKTAQKVHLDYVLQKWSEIPALEDRRTDLTEDVLDELKRHRSRTQITPQMLLKNASDMPEGLSVAILHQWFYKKTSSARKDHLEYVLNRWKSFPDCRLNPGRMGAEHKNYGYVEITSKIRKTLNDYKEQTGMGAGKLLENAQAIPAGLNAAIINNWLCGATKTARSEYLEYVMQTWKSLAQGEQKRIKLTPGIIATLNGYRRQVKRFPSYVLEATNIPKGLNSHIISSWFSNGAKTARKDHLDFVLERCKKLD